MWEKEKAWPNKVRLVTLLAIDYNELDHEALVEFLNTFVIKGFEIYFGRRNVAYVNHNQLMIDNYGVC
jgi:hypothetical protein